MRKILEQEAAQMMTELLRIRESFAHGGNRGGEAEATVREFLRKHLPIFAAWDTVKYSTRTVDEADRQMLW